MTDEGWRPLRPPRRHIGEQRGPSIVASPFVRLARVHAFGAGSDAALAVALAGSIFFSISPDDARWRVALYLALTVAPFAVVTPLIGPVIDRIAGGRKAMIVATTIGRLIVAYFLIRHIETLWLFPLAFALLVLQKGYAVAKSAVVPRYVQSEDDLVDANSRLALISAVISMFGAAVGAGFSLIGGSSWAAGVAMIGYLVATVLAFRLPGVKVASAPPQALEKAELRSVTILLAGTAMAVMRGAVGFVTFFLAFEFRGGEESLDVSGDGAAVGGLTATARGVDITGDPRAPVWHFGLVILAAGIGALFGARIAPKLRTRFSEESMLVGVLAGASLAAALAALFGGLFGACILAFAVAAGAGAGKLAFDALVQRDAPDANHGRSFARFEARFQIAWVIGAFIPTIVALGTGLGSGLVAAVVGFALISYMLGKSGRRAVRPSLAERRAERRAARRAEIDGAVAEDLGGAETEAPPTPVEEEGGAAVIDPTIEEGLDDTVQLDRSRAESWPPAPPPAPWWGDQPTPTVSTVEGVEVDEPGPSSSLPPIEPNEPARPDDES